MFGSVILDVGLGVILVYLLMSVVCSSINEVIAWMFSWRSKTLREGIQQLLNDPTVPELAGKIYSHPLIKSLSSPGRGASYIPSRAFALALLDVLKGEASRTKVPAAPTGGSPISAPEARLQYEPLSFVGIRDTIASLPANSELKRLLSVLIDESVTSVGGATRNIAHWFDGAMDRVSGGYRRRSQIVLYVCGFALSLGLNLDTFMLVKMLSRDSALRASLVAAAQEVAKQPRPEVSSTGAQPQDSFAVVMGVEEKLEQIQFPVGWSKEGSHMLPDNFADACQKLAGILLTTFALSLGAPFWFDSLNKIVNLRSAGKPPARAQ